ncbi:MAG: ABC transporter permease [Rhodospirillales bacterium]|nr:ABC transporter permease [Rhodospirillales bacterium]
MDNASDRTATRRPSRLRPEYILIPLLFVIIVSTWQAVTVVFEIPPYLVPKPTEIFAAFVGGVSSGIYLLNAWYTLVEALGGFLIAAFLGLVIGTLIAQSQLVERTLYPYLITIQTTPKVAIAPLFVIWFGFGLTSKIIIAATVAFFPILVNVIAGLRSIDKDKVELMRSLNASPWQVFRMAQLPNALPIIFAGLQVAVVFSILGAIVGEFVGSKVGLGNIILQANTNLDAAGVFGALVCLSIMGIALHLAMSWLQRKLVFWADNSVIPTS